MNLNKFIPLSKMEEQSDGTLHVFGTVTAQLPDLEKEVCDYEGTKPLYEKRAKENLEKTSIPGMTPSFMPFREMHKAITQGAGRSLECDDATKTIKMSFHVVDAEAVKKWRAGCFVGFSQGGSYVKRWEDPDFPGCTRYIADPMEVSAVDSPCLPSALVESMKGRTVTLAKADGVTEEVRLQTITVDDTRMAKLEADVAELVVLLKAQKEAHGTISIESANKTSESAASGKGASMDLEKAKSIHGHLEALKGAHEKMGEHIEKCMKACSDAIGGEDKEEKAAVVEITKAADSKVEEKVDELTKALAELTAKLEKTAATPPAHTGNGVVNKTIDVAPELAALLQ